MSYLAHYNADRTRRLHEAAVALLCRQRMYLDPNLTASQVAAALGCDPRTLSAALAHNPHKNFRALLAATRVAQACRLLRNAEYADSPLEEIALYCGFRSRQAFYLAFQNIMGMTPRQYRLKPHAL